MLIVSLGDSYGSGEGNPDLHQIFDPRPESFFQVHRPTQWVDKRCHRSATAGPAEAARRLEASDPKTSVTFLSFACSGATIDTMWGTDAVDPYKPPEPGAPTNTGILGPYSGVEPPEDDDIHSDYRSGLCDTCHWNHCHCPPRSTSSSER